MSLSRLLSGLVALLVSAHTAFADTLPVPDTLIGGTKLNLWTTPVALIEDDVMQCSGVLVGTNLVITAGHCALELKPEKTVVYVGGGFYTVENSYFNSAYDPFGEVEDQNQQHDLGLLVLTTHVVGVAPLPVVYSDPLKRGEAFFIYGYGANELSGEGFGPRGIFDDARGAILRAERVKNGIIRADHFLTGASVCLGDSGGPATQIFGNHAGVIGITTYTTNGDFFGACTLGLGVSGIVDLQSKSSQAFLSFFPGVARMSGPLAVFETFLRGVRDRLGSSLTTAQNTVSLDMIKSAAADARSGIKKAKKLTKDKMRRARLEAADKNLSRVRKSKDYLSAIELAARAFLSIDQAVALGIN